MMEGKKWHKIEASVYREASDLDIKRVLVALSGGADSVSIAYALKQCRIQIIALHCNFHLRGEESNRDETFVKEFCTRHNIQLKVNEFNLTHYLEKHKGVSLEMACRDLRYDWFRDQLVETGFDRIVTGHNADDNIETFFLNLFRGSGTRGLKGMIRDSGKVWRPLLQFHRKDILEYNCNNHLDYVVDSTNLENDFRRNLLRNKILPLIKEEWKGFDVALDKTIANLQTENKIVEKTIQDALPQAGESLKVATIIESPAPLLLIKRYIEEASPFSSTPEEILSAIKANKPHIRRWKLKKGEVLLRNGQLFIEMIHGKGCS